MTAKLISITPNAEETTLYIARVSSPKQDNPKSKGLLKYCIDHNHWSVFEHAYCTIELETSRAISAQIVRHKSFAFSEFSLRYSSNIPKHIPIMARKQSSKNRQSSVEICDSLTIKYFDAVQEEIQTQCIAAYKSAIEKGIAKEQARYLLPLGTPTKLYMSGTVRSWIHYCILRTQPDTQEEHRVLAEECKRLLCQELPTIGRALGWIE